MYLRSPSQVLKDSIKQVASPMLDALGAFDGWIQRVRTDSSVWTILMYHRVIADAADDPFGLGMCVRRRHFEDQIAYLKRDFHILSMQEAIGRLQRGEPLPAAALSVTFDDGYLDNLTEAQPVLERHGVPWTLFVATGDLDEGRAFWWDRVIRAFALTQVSCLDPDGLPTSTGQPRLSLVGAQRRASLQTVLAALWDMPIEQALRFVDAIERRLIPQAAAREGLQAPRLNRAQLRQLASKGVEIGAHTERHPNLNLLPADEAVQEMTRSRDILEEMLDTPVPGFAYPGGRMNQDVVERARNAGFRYAVSTLSCLNILPCDHFLLGRVGMPDAGVADFKRSLHGIAHRCVGRA